MGALAVALGLPSVHAQLTRGPPPCSRIPRRDALKVSYPNQSRPFQRIDHVSCRASASWPYESRGDAEEDSSHGWTAFLELQEGGFEVLAIGLGVAVSVALAVSRHGAPVGILSLAFLTAASVALRHQIAALCGVLISQFNSIQAAMAVHLSSMRNNVIIWVQYFVLSI